MKKLMPNHVTRPKKMTIKKAMIILSSAALLLPGAGIAGSKTVQAQSAALPVQSANAATQSESAKILSTFQSLLKKDNLRDATVYLNEHIQKATEHHATLMVLYLENARNKAMPVLDQKFYPQAIQKELASIYKQNDSIDNLMKKAKTPKLKSLLTEAKIGGYKMLTAEGMYYLIMDYSTLARYQNNVKDDISAYVDIMTTETDKNHANDAALAIGYQELVNRALAQEAFLLKYPSSNRVGQITTLYSNYKYYVFYGLNNTPLFLYKDNTMQPNARKAYEFIAQLPNNNDSKLRNQLNEFMGLVKNAKYKKTAKVDGWLKANVMNSQ